VSTGRPTIVARVTDALSGVDPHSLLLEFGTGFNQLRVGATSYDPKTGIAIFSIPRDGRPIDAGPEFMRIIASDYQETKNIHTEGVDPMPNTRFGGVRFTVVARPTVSWIQPTAGKCLTKPRAVLQVVAGSNAVVSSVGLFDGKRQIARVRKNVAGVYTFNWKTTGKRRGKHTLTAVASDTRGREAEVTRVVRICR
jgi:hypothetical protein